MDKLKNIDKMYFTTNKNIEFLIREYQKWHLDTYNRKARIEDFEKHLGITKQSLYHSIHNVRKPSSEKIMKLSLFFDIDMDTLCKVDLETHKEWPELSKNRYEKIGSIGSGKIKLVEVV